MNYQLLLECFASGVQLSQQEIKLLDLELYTQIESIKVSSFQGCLEVAPDQICQKAMVCSGSLWITCLASILDQLTPVSLGNQARGSTVFDILSKMVI